MRTVSKQPCVCVSSCIPHLLVHPSISLVPARPEEGIVSDAEVVSKQEVEQEEVEELTLWQQRQNLQCIFRLANSAVDEQVVL